MQDFCDNCNGTGYVREGYDGESPCEFCNHENFVNWLRDEWRQSEMKNEKLQEELTKLKCRNELLELQTKKACRLATGERHKELAEAYLADWDRLNEERKDYEIVKHQISLMREQKGDAVENYQLYLDASAEVERLTSALQAISIGMLYPKEFASATLEGKVGIGRD